jgi:hypothetical protein
MGKIDWNKDRNRDLIKYSPETTAKEASYSLPIIIKGAQRDWFLKRARIRGWKSLEEEEVKIPPLEIKEEPKKAPIRGTLYLF